MAFIGQDFIKASGQANGFVMHTFSSTTDNLAAVKASGYFDDAAANGGWGLKDGDFILVTASDGESILKIDVTSLVATTASANDFA